MNNIVRLTASDGSEIEFINDGEPAASGSLKDVYFSPDKSYVVAFYRKPLDNQGLDRIKKITTTYREKIFTPEQRDFWSQLFCWPTKIVTWNNKTGLVCPCYDMKYFFSEGTFKGKEKEGKWFASAKLVNRYLTPKQKGNFVLRLKMCIQIARAIRKLHACGLAHSDLSYKNVLVDPESGSATVIDIDGLVVPGKYPPDVEGTQDFIAPEVLETNQLGAKDPNKNLPRRETDLHALAVLIYMYLLNRHPLRGGKFHSPDTEEDELLMMGKEALFIENPKDNSNRPKIQDLDKDMLPQGDIDKRPYTICGPYLKKLFEKAFISGLHNPKLRPSAYEWEKALIKTSDLIFKCKNSKCEEGYFVFDSNRTPECPYCKTKHSQHLPIMNLYVQNRPGSFTNEHHRIVVYNGLGIYPWQVDSLIEPNENLKEKDKYPVADCQIVKGKWLLINRKLQNLVEILPNKQRVSIPVGKAIELKEGTKILFDSSDSSKLAFIQIL